MTTDITLSPRQRMLLDLASDLEGGGWDQRSKIWFVKGDLNDEWLAFHEEFSGNVENHLVDLTMASALPDDAHGVLVVSEGWDYPQRIREGLKTDAALRAYWRTTPPSEHPERVEIRHLVLACNDGEVIGLTVTNSADPVMKWARLDASNPSPVGDRVVDASRALLGINDKLSQRISQVEGLQAIANIATVLDRAVSGASTEEEVTRDLFLALPDGLRAQVVKDMPEDVREAVRAVLSEEERRQFGL